MELQGSQNNFTDIYIPLTSVLERSWRVLSLLSPPWEVTRIRLNRIFGSMQQEDNADRFYFSHRPILTSKLHNKAIFCGSKCH
jgi:hypothetical protein